MANRRGVLLSIALFLGGCLVGDLVPEGRPCGPNQPCGPGTVCNGASGTCVSQGGGKDARPDSNPHKKDARADARDAMADRGDLRKPDTRSPDQFVAPDGGCPKGKTYCNGVCADLATDKKHCGACNSACKANADICVAGKCYCGTTAKVCGIGLDCVSGKCRCKPGGRCKGCCQGDTCVAMSAQKSTLCGKGGMTCKTCVDGNLCTVESCSLGQCKIANAPSTTKCNDSRSCTYNDQCAGGKCVGLPYYCDDKKVCTTDTCTGVNKGCTHTVKTGYCLIGGVCYANGYTNTAASHGCFYCNASKNKTMWSYKLGCVVTLAGMGSSGLVNGAATSARFNSPMGLATDSTGTKVWVADRSNNVIRQIYNKQVTTFAGSTYGYKDGSATTAQFRVPSDLARDSTGKMYVADRDNHCIRVVFSSGSVSTAAGTCGLSGTTDGLANVAKFNSPQGLIMDGDNTIYIADTANHRIRRLYYANVYTQAGSSYGYVDGASTAAKFYAPIALSLYNKNGFYIADMYNHRIRRIYGTTTYTLAGSGQGFVVGPLATAKFYYPRGVAVGPSGEVYVSDSGNNVIRRIWAAQAVVFAGSASGYQGFVDGHTTSARFKQPYGLAVANGMLFIADTGNHAIRVMAIK